MEICILCVHSDEVSKHLRLLFFIFEALSTEFELERISIDDGVIVAFRVWVRGW